MGTYYFPTGTRLKATVGLINRAPVSLNITVSITIFGITRSGNISLPAGSTGNVSLDFGTITSAKAAATPSGSLSYNGIIESFVGADSVEIYAPDIDIVEIIWS